MNRTTIVLILIIIQLAGLSACRKEEKKTRRIALISGLGGFNDKSFNQSSLVGFNRARQDFEFIAAERESFSLKEISDNLNNLSNQNFDLIIAMGYNFATPVLDAARTHPNTQYLIIDYQYDDIPDNVQCALYAVDQSSFPAGVLAAYWADHIDTQNPVAAWLAGPDTTISGQFQRGYTHGIAWFNSKYNKNVAFAGRTATSYVDTVQGALLAGQLIEAEGADIVYPFAGMTGNGALVVAKQHQIRGIGVDVDQYYSLPGVKDILLTSCLKKVDNTVYDVIKRFLGGEFAGGSTTLNNLANDGVGLAPYHAYESQLPDSIKTLITKVLTDIRSGALSTGVKK